MLLTNYQRVIQKLIIRYVHALTPDCTIFYSISLQEVLDILRAYRCMDVGPIYSRTCMYICIADTKDAAYKSMCYEN